jgi:hypothetical protein
MMAVCATMFTQAQTELTQDATSNGAGLISGGNYTGYFSAGQMATYMFANGTRIATQGIILNEISGNTEFTFELSGNLTENETVTTGQLVMKSALAELQGTPLAFTKVYLLDAESGEILFETETDANGYFVFTQIPYQNFYFTVRTPEVPLEPVVLSFKDNEIFVKEVEINGEVGSEGITAEVVITPQLTSSSENEQYKTLYPDKDKDGFGDGAFAVKFNENVQPSGYVSNNLDCNDINAGINPDAIDVPGSGIDANCDGLFTWFLDADQDGFGSELTISSPYESPMLGESNNNLDCDDSNAAINPGASDAGGEDLNCDGIIDCTGITNLVFDAPGEPVSVDETVTLNITLEGNGTNLAFLDWGDETSGTVNISNGLISESHGYTSAGVYVLKLILVDDCGLQQTFEHKYIVIYDPNSGFVTGSGTIYSPPGASVQFPNAEGTATFGFVSKYDKQKIVPKGNTEFEFEAGDLKFVSTEYEWLVVAGSKAKFKGRGSINGIPGFQFMISAIDGDIKAKGDPDFFRIKIWNESTGEVVYDNEMGTGIDTDPLTQILEGSIKIHVPKLKSEVLTSAGDFGNPDKIEFNVYPNPTHGIVKITGFHYGKDYLVTIVDMNGREIQQKRNREAEMEIDLTSSPTGLYNLIIQLDNESKSYQVIRN